MSGAILLALGIRGRPPGRWSNARNPKSDHRRRERTPAGGRSKAPAAAVAGAAMTKRPFSLDIVGPSAGEYSASIVEVRLIEQPDRLLAVMTFALNSDPPFSVADWVLLDAERQSTETNRGRARLEILLAWRAVILNRSPRRTICNFL